MKILVIGNSNNYWVNMYIKNVLNSNNEIYLLNEFNIREEFYKTYVSKKVRLIGNNSNLYRIPKLGSFLKKINYVHYIRKLNNIDNCIILNTNLYKLKLWNKVRKQIKNTSILYWGSDILRITNSELLKHCKFLNNVDNIVFTSQHLQDVFTSQLNDKYNNKLKIIDFGSDSLNFIDELVKNYNRSDVKRELGLPTDKVIIAIGYCGIPEQQHLKILEQLAKLDDDFKSTICIMFQFMYKTSKDYRDKIIEYAINNNLNYISFDDFLEPKDLAKLRYSTDIFINAQTTDALANSVSESLYAGAKLVNAKWLDYPEYKKWGINYFEFDKFDNLNSALVNAISCKNYNFIARDEMKKHYDWSTCKDKWNLMLYGKQ